VKTPNQSVSPAIGPVAARAMVRARSAPVCSVGHAHIRCQRNEVAQ
jgi:hypothetical protein